MSLYRQTTESQKYLAAVGGIAPSTLQQFVQSYKFGRVIVLGLPAQINGPQGPHPLPQADLKPSERLAALGAGFGEIVATSVRLKAFVEAEVAVAVTKLGGWDAISPTGEWAFLFQDVTRNTDGAVTGYALPGLAFIYQAAQDSPAYGVNITVAQDGTGTAEFTPLDNNGTIGTNPL